MAMRFSLLALLSLTVACRPSSDSAGSDSTSSRVLKRIAVGEAVPAYSATSLTGGPASLAELRGNVVMLNVWATWCIPCRAELPDLQSLHERYQSMGLHLVGVSIDAGAEADRVTDYAKERGVSFALWHDPDDRISGVLLANGVPATYIIDREGKLRWRWMGPIRSNDPAMIAVLDTALAAQK